MQQSKISRQSGRFGETRWTLVLAAAERGDSTSGRAALAELCETYWYPLYAYVRRCGHLSHDAEDLTQEFFARLLAKNHLADASQKKGRFRSFLLASIKHFLANEWDRSQALKRGGGCVFFSLDVPSAESRHPLEPADNLTPEKIFDRQWILVLLDRVLARLAGEFAEDGRAAQFAELKDFLTAEAAPRATAAISAKLGTSEGTLRVGIHRMRRRYRELLRAEIAQTVNSPSEVDGEIRRLFSVFSESR